MAPKTARSLLDEDDEGTPLAEQAMDATEALHDIEATVTMLRMYAMRKHCGEKSWDRVWARRQGFCAEFVLKILSKPVSLCAIAALILPCLRAGVGGELYGAVRGYSGL